VVLAITSFNLLNIRMNFKNESDLIIYHFHVNSIKRVVILSQPVSSLVSLATKESNKFLRMEDASFPVFLSLLILVIIGWLSFAYFYQMPSHPIIMNSSSACLLTSVMSGLHVIGC